MFTLSKVLFGAFILLIIEVNLIRCSETDGNVRNYNNITHLQDKQDAVDANADKLNEISNITWPVNYLAELLQNQLFNEMSDAKTYFDTKFERFEKKMNEKANETLQKLENIILNQENRIIERLAKTINESQYQSYLYNQNFTKSIRDLLSNITKHEKENQTDVNVYNSCEEAIGDGCMKSSGIYQIILKDSSRLPFPVHCLRENNEIWTLIQRRQDGTENFTRNWNDYKMGFGNLNGEFFLGLEKIHLMTSKRKYKLRIILEDFEGNKRYANYDSFAISNENDQYALHTLGEYSGDAGDSLAPHRDKKFFTFDNDNDTRCAERHASGWWFYKCYLSNLNGLYREVNTSKTGVNWNSWLGGNYSLKYVHMAIKLK